MVTHALLGIRIHIVSHTASILWPGHVHESLSCTGVDYDYSAPHVPALALQTLMPLLVRTLASFLAACYLSFVERQYQEVNCTRSSSSHVAALTEGPRARP